MTFVRHRVGNSNCKLWIVVDCREVHRECRQHCSPGTVSHDNSRSHK